MINYKIYTERKHNIKRITSKYFEGFTLFNTIGFWKGKEEESVCIEIIGASYKQVKLLAKAIKRINNQESVYVIKENITAKLL